MKILQINAVSGISSTGRTSKEIADYLNQNGQEGHIAYSAGIAYAKGYKIGNKIDTKIHGLLSRFFGTQAYFSYFATKQLLKYMDQLEPDVVHLHNLHGNFIHLGKLLKHLAKNDIPTVVTLHDCWFYTGKCTHYTVDNCYKWQTRCGGCPRLRKDNPSWFFDRTRKMHVDKKKWFAAIPRLAVVGVSEWITGEARQSFLSSAKIITRINNWIDLEIFKPANTSDLRHKLGLQNKFVILGVASGWGKSKGLDKFIQLAGKVDSDVTIILVGSLKQIMKLPENVIHIKETHNTKELSAYYSLADVYLHLSLEETFGKTIAEALACGTPAIVFNSTACPELIGEGCGHIVPPGDLQGTLIAIEKIRSLGKIHYAIYCREWAAKNFQKDKNIQQTIDIYNSLLHYAG
jgi:glycosyltransferase involved in cell wall biosynthesis